MSDLEELTLRFQVYLERLKTGESNEFNATLQELSDEVAAILAEGEVSEMNRKTLETYLRGLRSDQSQVTLAATEDLISDMRDLMVYSHEFEVQAILTSTTVPKLKEKVSVNAMWKLAEEMPLSSTGELLEPWLAKLTETQIQAAEGIMRRANAESWSNREITKTFNGTRANGYRDGLLPKIGRANETLVRTAIQHVNSVARMKVWDDNESSIKGYQWVSTLDGRTSERCRALDGEKFKIGEGPLPPIHPNCRSTTIAVLDSVYDMLDVGGTRASKTGPVPRNETYYGWLKRQPAEFQDSVIGPTRGALLRNGGLTAEEFAEAQLNSTFEPLTLEEMRKLIPTAFTKAGV